MTQTKTNIKLTNLEAKPEVDAKVYDRINQIERFLSPKGDQEVMADVELEKKFGNHHKKGEIFRAEININSSGDRYRAEHTTYDIITALDDATEQIIKQVRRKKGRDKNLIRRGGRKIKKLLKFGRRGE